MMELRYPPQSLRGDYFRAGAGILVGFGVLLSVPPSPAIIVIFGGLAGLFSYFGYRTIERHISKVAVTDDGICNAGFRTRVIAWRDLKFLKLRYYGTKRQSRERGGFMQLTMKGGGTTLTCESNLQGFVSLAWHAAKAARENGVAVDETSAGNFLALGLDPTQDTDPPDGGL